MSRVYEFEDGDLIDLEEISMISKYKLSENKEFYSVLWKSGECCDLPKKFCRERLTSAWRAHMDGVVNVEAKQSVGEIPLDHNGEPLITDHMHSVFNKGYKVGCLLLSFNDLQDVYRNMARAAMESLK